MNLPFVSLQRMEKLFRLHKSELLFRIRAPVNYFRFVFAFTAREEARTQTKKSSFCIASSVPHVNLYNSTYIVYGLKYARVWLYGVRAPCTCTRARWVPCSILLALWVCAALTEIRNKIVCNRNVCGRSHRSRSTFPFWRRSRSEYFISMNLKSLTRISVCVIHLYGSVCTVCALEHRFYPLAYEKYT